ncbi:MAG: hypothetical protein P9M14_10005 [Candidatus Alcyoniella australis]|nr:hypothetical protein [Candidatus Alcyoniella australis]
MAEQATQVQSLINGFVEATDSGWFSFNMPSWWPAGTSDIQDPLLLLVVCLTTTLMLVSVIQNFRISRRVKRSLKSMSGMETGVADQLRAGLQAQRSVTEEANKTLGAIKPDLDRTGKGLAALHRQLDEMQGKVLESVSQLQSSMQGDSYDDPIAAHDSGEVLKAIKQLRGQFDKNMSLLDDLLALERAVTKMIGEEKVSKLIAKERRLKPQRRNSERNTPSKGSVLGLVDEDDDDLIPRHRR